MTYARYSSVPFAVAMAKTQLHKMRVLSGGHPLPRTVLNARGLTALHPPATAKWC